MKNTYAIVFEDYMNNKADQETVLLFVCSLLNELEETNGPEKAELIRTIQYIGSAAKTASESTNDEEKGKFWNRINELIKSAIEKEEVIANG